LRPWIAAHVWSATTATPPSGLKPNGGVESGSRTTLRTPGTASAFESSTRFGRPPTTGGRSTTAVSMPGRRTSAP
jgi:hypothetical protein